jgi:branched-chain amino acid transport system substrate-binding protein
LQKTKFEKKLMIRIALSYYLGMVLMAMALGLCCAPPAWAAPRGEIVVGTQLPLTGAFSGAGREQKWAYEEAVKDVNATGGIFVKEYGKKVPVRLIVLDDESNPVKSARAVERLITIHKVDMLLSGFALNDGVIPACVAAEKYKKYYHASMTFVPSWLKHKFQWSTLFFFDLEQGVAVPFQLWNSLPRGERPKKPALMVEDSPDGRVLAGLFQSVSQRYGYGFALTETLAMRGMDYSAQIQKAKAMGVDAILIFSSDTDCITFVRQMKKCNFSVGYFHGWKGTWSGNLWKELGKDCQYILCDGFWSMEFPLPGAKELGERYLKRFGETSVSVGCAYALAQILWQAIEKAGTLDGKKVRNAVLSSRFETVMGPVKYQSNGVATFMSTANQWIDGKQELVYPFKWAKATVKPAPPWGERR